ncbi:MULTISPECIES: methyltransferase domain-containing protein [unclassified Streptomyces]|uniref:methyltransferase domain-containing protein n=1 Tax=unclassified Streptomyces TaxID=2593676 RepID=UPI0036EC4CF5
MHRLRTLLRDLDERRRHRSTARAVQRVDPEPESWLDVGTGDARFPAAARRLFPYTSFDGLDPTPRVLPAWDAERIDEAYVGDLTDPHLTRVLAARYDVVSMRHSTDGLDAALTLLRPGGHLLLETTAAAADALRAELAALHCAIVPTRRHPLLDRLSGTTRLVARRAPSPA